jgi:hypothetical protein
MVTMPLNELSFPEAVMSLNSVRDGWNWIPKMPEALISMLPPRESQEHWQ